MESNRRRVLRGLASLPLISGGAFVMADPVYAAIEKHKAAFAHLAVILHEDKEDDPRADPAGEAERDMLDALGETVPTTKPGLLALVEYLEERIDQDDSLAHEILVPPIAEACRKLLTV